MENKTGEFYKVELLKRRLPYGQMMCNTNTFENITCFIILYTLILVYSFQWFYIAFDLLLHSSLL